MNICLDILCVRSLGCRMGLQLYHIRIMKLNLEIIVLVLVSTLLLILCKYPDNDIKYAYYMHWSYHFCWCRALRRDPSLLKGTCTTESTWHIACNLVGA